jgi:probable HAF family extracellular repeat protein
MLLSAVAQQSFGAPTYYTITNLGTLGGDSAAALDINNNGQVVGYSYDSQNQRRGFLYQNGSMTDVGTLAGASTVARSINDAGQIAGSSYLNTVSAYRAYVDNNGTLTNLGTLPGDFDSYARAINSSGQVVGISRDFSYNAHAFLYDNGAMTNLGNLAGYAQSKAYDINDCGQIAGVSYNFLDNGHAFLYSGGTMTDLGTLGGASSYARAVNNAGQVVGGSYNSSSIQRAFLYQNGTMTDLGSLGGLTSYARDINNNGMVVGSSETAAAGVYHAFVSSNGAMTDLKSLIDPASKWSLRSALSINDSGSIVGVGVDAAGDASAYMLTPITREFAKLSVLAAYTNLRMMKGSTAAVAGGSIEIDAAGYTATGYALSSSGVSITAPTGAVVPAAVTAVPFGMSWTDTSHVGAKSANVTLANTSDPSGTGNASMTVTGAVVANRVLNVAPLGVSSAPVRIMAKKSATTTISTGNDAAVDSDDAATRVKTVAGGKIKSGAATITYAATQPGGSLLSQFDGVGQTANVAMSFTKTGHYAGTVNLAPVTSGGVTTAGLLSDGETSSFGATVLPANLAYDVNVLDPRRLKTTANRINFGDVLRGATVSGNFGVTSTNRNADSSATTMVNVAPGGSQLGELTVAQTLVSSASAVNVGVSGKLNNYGTTSVKGYVPVGTAEAASVQDTTAYKDLSVRYTANVGIAKFGKNGGTSFGSGETVLSANVAAGSTLSHLSSKVDPKKTLAANMTSEASVTGLGSLPAKTLYGAVGSEAEIVESTALGADSTVTMQWRKRLPGEAGVASGLGSSTLPAGAWLTSDVVKIGGVASGVSYALQMTFDNRINRAIDGPTAGTVANELPGLYLAQFNTTANKWLNAATSSTIGSDAEQGVLMSLSNFLAANPTSSLADLQGSWGVDPVTSSIGTGHSWAIVAGGGSGIFAVDPSHSMTFSAGGSSVVPEPSSFAILIAAAAGLLGYAMRRRLRV